MEDYPSSEANEQKKKEMIANTNWLKTIAAIVERKQISKL